MAKWLDNFREGMKNTRTRMMVIIVAVVVVLALVYFISRLFDTSGGDGSARLSSVPASIQSVPGRRESQQYLKTLLQSNREQAERALRTGHSEIATLVASPTKASSVNFNAQSAPQGKQGCYHCCEKTSEVAAAPDEAADSVASILQQMEKSRQISSPLVGQIQQLANEGLTPAESARKLQQFVKDGKLSPAAAQTLEVAYRKKYQQQASPSGVLNQLVSSGEITSATAAVLKKANAENLTPADYAQHLAQLVKAGKLPPLAARRLLTAYQKSRQMAKKQAALAATPPADLVGQMRTIGQLSASTAQALNALAAQQVTPVQYGEKLAQLVKEGVITPAQAKKLLAAYEAQHAGQEGSSGAAQSGLAKLESQQQGQEAQQFQQKFTQEQKKMAEQQEQQLQKEQQAMQQAISTQMQQLIGAWRPDPQRLAGEFIPPAPKQIVAGKTAGATGAAGQAAASASGAPVPTGPPLVKTGAILFAVLDTAVNSDQPGPVMATIVAGKFKGAKLLGALQVTPDSERVILSFDVMTMPDWSASVKVSAVAIDPDTARTALASDVDHHYLSRYSALFASSFLEGLGDAIQKSGSTVVNNAGSTSQTFDDLSAGEKALVGLGQVGKNLGEAAQKEFNRKPTITVNSGIGLGILFTSDVKEPTFLAKKQSATSASTTTEEQG